MRYNEIMFKCLSRKIVAVLFFFLLPLIPLGAFSFKEDIHWAFRGSILVFASDNGRQGADSAPIAPSLGGSLAYQFWGPLRVEISEDIYFKHYEYNSLGYPMACSQDNRAALVVGFLTGLQIVGVFPIGSRRDIDVRVFGGPAVDLRIVRLSPGLNHPNDSSGDIETDAQLQKDAIRDYFWSSGRWFLPVFGAGMDFPITERYSLGFDLRAWFPVYRIWADKQIPAIDGWRFGIGFRIAPRKDY